MSIVLACGALLGTGLAAMPKEPPTINQAFRQDRLLFPPMALHNHGSCVVELPNGDLLACWYRGSGERSADDVAIVGARLRKGARSWSEAFPLADTPGFPDCNPCMIVAPDGALWLFWPTILDNQWESALLKYQVSRSFQQRTGPPRWDRNDVLHLKPGPEFEQIVLRDLEKQWAPYRQGAAPEDVARLEEYLALVKKRAATRLNQRLGWMPRPHPVAVGGRLLLPLYSDGFDFSLVAYSDDNGTTWKCSEPIVGAGNVQPSIAARRDGTLVAYFRDNGPPPKRALVSESRDRGHTWSLARDSDVVDTGAGVEVLVLRSGRWLLINNDLERGRWRLSISISEDEGKTWPRVTRIEDDGSPEGAGSYHYPSILQARDGLIHITYSYTPNAKNAAREGKGESIKHVVISEEWLLQNARGR